MQEGVGLDGRFRVEKRASARISGSNGLWPIILLKGSQKDPIQERCMSVARVQMHFLQESTALSSIAVTKRSKKGYVDCVMNPHAFASPIFARLIPFALPLGDDSLEGMCCADQRQRAFRTAYTKVFGRWAYLFQQLVQYRRLPDLEIASVDSPVVNTQDHVHIFH